MISKILALVITITVSRTVYGCGIVSQERTISFKVTIYNIPAQMLYSEDKAATSLAPFISTSEDKAIIFVKNLVERTVEEVLYEQGRSAGLSDDVISLILQQFDIKITYEPLKCVTVYTGMGQNAVDKMNNCEIKDNTLTAICVMMNACNVATNLIPTPSKYRTILGTIQTSNSIMASWSRQMWRSILNRAIQRVASGQFTQFSGASATID